MKEIPLVKIFLISLCSITLGIYGYFLTVSLLPADQATPTMSIRWLDTAEQDLRLRQEPGLNSPVLRTLQLGEHLQLITEDDNWLKVEDSQGNEGWVDRSCVVFSPPGLQ